MKRLLPLVLLPLLLSGCAALIVGAIIAAGVVGVGAYSYADNILSRDYDASVPQCAEAARRALKSMQLPVLKEDSDAQRTLIDSRTAKDTVQVRVHPRPEGKTRVAVQVGTFATDEHETAAKSIHERIYRELTGAYEPGAKSAGKTSAPPPSLPPPPPASGANEVREEFVVDYDRVWAAALGSVARLNFRNLIQSRDALKGVIRCQRADGSPVEIAVERLESGGSRVAVRVGMGKGQEHAEAGRAVLNQVRKELGGR